MIKDSNLHKLAITSTLTELDLFEASFDAEIKTKNIVAFFKSNLLSPGIILRKKNQYFGFISRFRFFEHMNNPFYQELYYNRPLINLYHDLDERKSVIFDVNTKILDAAFSALQRPVEFLYEPVIVKNEKAEYFLLDTHQLYLAQSYINKKMVTKLEEANEFKSELLGIAAHDLKNPLNSIMGFANLISDESEGEINEMSRAISSAANRMLDLIKNLLESISLELCQSILEKKYICIKNLTNEVIRNNLPSASKKKQNIITNFGIANEYIVYADPLKLSEVIDNLLSNAIKYSPSGKEINIYFEDGKDVFTFIIKDEGPGLNKCDQKKLFERFQCLTPKPTGGESSTGLGLYIVKQIINQHNGKIWIESEEGKGSAFKFTLPTKTS